MLLVFFRGGAKYKFLDTKGGIFQSMTNIYKASYSLSRLTVKIELNIVDSKADYTPKKKSVTESRQKQVTE